jgi:hypothetical protein
MSRHRVRCMMSSVAYARLPQVLGCAHHAASGRRGLGGRNSVRPTVAATPAVESAGVMSCKSRRCYTWYVWHAAWCMLHVVCCMLSAACCLQHGVCCLLHFVCSMLSAACCLLHGVCCLLPGACCMFYAACCLQHDVCCLLHGVCCMFYAACCLLHVVCCLLHGVCCMLSVVCCMGYVACARCLQERTDSSRRARRQHVYPSALGACSAAPPPLHAHATQ